MKENEHADPYVDAEELDIGGLIPQSASMKMAPSIVKELVGLGYFLHGSRSKLSVKEVGEDADWDLTGPLDEPTHKTRAKLLELGFVDSSDKLMRDSRFDEAFEENEGYFVSGVNDPNIHYFYTHPEHPVSVIINLNEDLFRTIWKNICSVTFRHFVWKRSPCNAGLSDKLIRQRRFIFMMNQYAQVLGRPYIMTSITLNRRADCEPEHNQYEDFDGSELI